MQYMRSGLFVPSLGWPTGRKLFLNRIVYPFFLSMADGQQSFSRILSFFGDQVFNTLSVLKFAVFLYTSMVFVDIIEARGEEVEVHRP